MSDWHLVGVRSNAPTVSGESDEGITPRQSCDVYRRCIQQSGENDMKQMTGNETVNGPAVGEQSDPTNRRPERSDGQSSSTTVSRRYGEALKEFEWSYLVHALPVRSTSATPQERARGYGDSQVKRFLRGAIRDLETYQDGPIYWAFALENGQSGWRHAHVLLGALSRLQPMDVVEAFQENRFGNVRVELWNASRESGYMFKALDQRTNEYDDFYWDTNVTWNRRCRARMKLNAKFLRRTYLHLA